MNSKTLLRLFVTVFCIFCGLLVVESGLFSQPARPRGCLLLQATAESAPANEAPPQTPTPAAGAPTPAPPPAAETQPSLAAPAQGLGFGALGGPPASETLGSQDKQTGFKFKLELDSKGAAIRSATLSEYENRDHKNPQPLVFLSPVRLAAGREVLSMANRELTLTQEKQQLGLDRLSWKSLGVETAADGSQTARFEAVITDPADQPLLKLTKTYTVKRDSYLLDCNLTLENLSKSPKGVRWNLAGPLGVEREDPGSDDRKIVGGFRDAKGQIVGVRINAANFDSHKTFAEEVLGSDQKNQEFLWAAGINKYFAAVLVPLPQDGKTSCDWITGRRNQAGARDTMLQDKKGWSSWLRRLFTGKADTVSIEKTGRYGQYYNPDGRPATGDESIGVGLETDYANLAPAGGPDASRTYGFQLYLGPKDNSLFEKNTLYRQLGFVQTIDFPPCCCCPANLISPVAFAIVAIMKWMHVVIPNYGIVIIVLVFLVRLLLHPVTKMSQVSMYKMSKLAPRAEEIKKKCAGNQVEMNRQLMALYREQGISPVMSMLPMFLQMPLWVALWSAVYTSIDLRAAPFLPFWITDLSLPDALVSWPAVTIPLLGWKLTSLNLLPILMGVAFYLQQKLTPTQTTAATNPQMAQQQKMMMIMIPVLFPLSLYTAPSGVNLYIMASTFAGVIEQRVIQKHIRQREQAGSVGLVAVTSKTGGKLKKKKPKPFYRF